MNNKRRNQAIAILTALVKILKIFQFALEIHKNGNMEIVEIIDIKNSDRYKISAEDLKILFEEDFEVV